MKDLSSFDAVILCGGLGTRLRSEMGQTPKVMAPVDGQPFLELLIHQLKSQGFERIILCTGYKSDFIERHFKGNSLGVTMEFSRETEPLGTGGALKNARAFIQSDPFFVLNGDSICVLNFKNLCEFHKKKKSLVSVGIGKVKNPGDFGSIVLDATDRILAFQEKIPSDGLSIAYVNAGVYCFSRDIFKKMPEAHRFSLEKDFFPTLTKDAFFGFVVEESFWDIGTPERYRAASKFLKKG